MMKATEYTLGYGIRIVWRGDSSGVDRWAIVDSVGNVLGVDGEWEIEPQPSSRTDEFIARTRFASADEAEQVYLKWSRQ